MFKRISPRARLFSPCLTSQKRHETRWGRYIQCICQQRQPPFKLPQLRKTKHNRSWWARWCKSPNFVQLCLKSAGPRRFDGTQTAWEKILHERLHELRYAKKNVALVKRLLQFVWTSRCSRALERDDASVLALNSSTTPCDMTSSADRTPPDQVRDFNNMLVVPATTCVMSWSSTQDEPDVQYSSNWWDAGVSRVVDGWDHFYDVTLIFLVSIRYILYDLYVI